MIRIALVKYNKTNGMIEEIPKDIRTKSKINVSRDFNKFISGHNNLIESSKKDNDNGSYYFYMAHYYTPLENGILPFAQHIFLEPHRVRPDEIKTNIFKSGFMSTLKNSGEIEYDEFLLQNTKELVPVYDENGKVKIEILEEIRDPLDDFLKGKANIRKEKDGTKWYDMSMLPIVHLTNRDFFDEDNSEKLPQYKKIIDSSIWNYYFSLNANKGSYEKLTEIVKKISENFDKGLYFTSNALEIADFRARQLFNSYISKFVDGHAEYISPFTFHSEQEMSEDADKKLKDIRNEYGGNLNWRFLIVDDNAYLDSKSAERCKIEKCKIIANVINRDFYLECVNQKSDCICKKEWISTLNKGKERKDYAVIQMDCAKTNTDAKKEITSRRYDIILLDFLLGEKEGKVNMREYGTELLEDIRKAMNAHKTQSNHENTTDESDLEKAKGPFGKYWFFFISAFTNAISEKMLSEGMHYNEDQWLISRGACPTTTPELFRYNLYSFMLRQLEEITQVKTINISDTNKKSGIVEILEAIYKDPKQTRTNAIKGFNAVLSFKAKYEQLRIDFDYRKLIDKEKKSVNRDNGSKIIQSYYKDVIDIFSAAFWEHLQHLVYLTAFGTIRQWPEMWEEFIVFVKPHLLKYDTIDKNQLGEKVYKHIESYISSLRNNC